MAAKEHGTAYVYGVAAANPTSAQIITCRLVKTDQNKKEVKNSSGQCISERDDDQIDTIAIALRVEAGYSKPAMSSTLVITGGVYAGTYKITNTDDGTTVDDYVTFQVTAEKKEYMTYS